MEKQELLDFIEKVKKEIDDGYHKRDDYPPYAIASWDDRNRYRQYIFKILDEVASEKC